MVQSITEAMRIAQERFKAQKGNHTELRKTVTEWSADDAVHVDPPIDQQAAKDVTMHTAPDTPAATAPQEKPPTTHALFNYLRAHPGMRRRDVVARVAAMGYNRGSVSSLVGQMMLQKYVVEDPNGLLFLRINEYKPLVSGKQRDQLIAARRAELAAAKTARASKPPKKSKAETLKAMRDRAAYARAVLAAKRAVKAQAKAKAKAKAPAKARPAPPRAKAEGLDRKPAPMTADIIRPPMKDIRSMSGEQIVKEMSVIQAKDVFARLSELFSRK